MNKTWKWIGKSIGELDIRKKYQINILGIKEKEKMNLLPEPGHIFNDQEHVMIIGRKEDLDQVLQKLEKSIL